MNTDNIATPQRIQRKRTKGWKMPPNTVSVARPGKFGNPFTVEECMSQMLISDRDKAQQICVSMFRDWILDIDGAGMMNTQDLDQWQYVRDSLHTLKGKNLACFCRLDQPCHADVLLELANAEKP